MQIGRKEVMLQSQKANHSFHTSRSTRGVSSGRLGGGEWGKRGKHAAHCGKFTRIIVGRACAVGIDIADVGRLQTSSAESGLHG